MIGFVSVVVEARQVRRWIPVGVDEPFSTERKAVRSGDMLHVSEYRWSLPLSSRV
jgi:hypothetical protein